MGTLTIEKKESFKVKDGKKKNKTIKNAIVATYESDGITGTAYSPSENPDRRALARDAVVDCAVKKSRKNGRIQAFRNTEVSIVGFNNGEIVSKEVLVTKVTQNVDGKEKSGQAILYHEDTDDASVGISEAIANFECGSFRALYRDFAAAEKAEYRKACYCKYCGIPKERDGKLFDTPEDARACEKKHVERWKNKKAESRHANRLGQMVEEIQLRKEAETLLAKKKTK